MTAFATLEDLRSHVGRSLGPSRSVTLTQDTIDAFAAVTGDHQWIHTDPVRAAGTAHGSTIAHGFLTLSLLAPFLEDLLEVQDVHTSVNYGLNRVRFPAPVPANSTVHCTGTIASIDEIGTATQVVAELTVHSDTSLKPVCVAEIILRLLR